MVDNQHKKITGYRDLTETEINLMNEIKDLESQVAFLLRRVLESGGDDVALMSAQRKLIEGFMWAVRSVARPANPWMSVGELRDQAIKKEGE